MKCAVVVLAMLSSIAGEAHADGAAAGVRLPGGQNFVPAPGGRYAVVCLPAGQGTQGAENELVLKDLASGKSRPLQAFGTWAVVLWASSGKRLAVTMGVGNDKSEVWVHRVEELSLPFDVWQTLQQQRKDGLAFAAGADHRYVEAVSWWSETELVARVWGYGGAKPFDRQLKVKLPE